MSSNSPGGASKLATVKTLLATANTIFSNQNWSTTESILKKIVREFSAEDGNFTISINATAPYETTTVQAVSPMYLYFTPFLVTLGITGNILSIYVICKSKTLRQQSSSQYLCALAASDSVFLLQLLPAWLNSMGMDNFFFMQEYCTYVVYLSYVTCTLSSWLVLAFTVERCIAVLYPLQRSAVCTVRRARCIILALTGGSFLFNIPVLNFAGTAGVDCGIAKDKLKDAERFNWADTTIVFTLPLIVILCVNIWIVVTLFRFGRTRLRLMKEGRDQEQSEYSDPDQAFTRVQRRITNMLLLVSSVFFLFNFPAYVMRLCAYSYDWESTENGETLLAAQIASMVLFYSTFGINFFLYCLSGQNFRRALMQHVPCIGWLARQVLRFFSKTRPNTARAPSVTTSAASNGVDTSCNLSCARRRPQRYIYRMRFNNRWRSNRATSGARPESFEMQEMAPRAGPSRVPEPAAAPSREAASAGPSWARSRDSASAGPSCARSLDSANAGPSWARSRDSASAGPSCARSLDSANAGPSWARSRDSASAGPSWARSRDSASAGPSWARSRDSASAGPSCARSRDSASAGPSCARPRDLASAAPSCARSRDSVSAGPSYARSRESASAGPSCALSQEETTQRRIVSRRITLSRVVTLEESKYSHLRRDPQIFTLSGAERRKAQSYLYD